MATIIDLSTLGSAGFLIRGDAGDDYAGFSVSDAGDINGDGFADIIVGAPFGDDEGSEAGEAYVIFGKASGFGPIDLSSLGAAGFVITGHDAGDAAGISVSSAGDINGDGFDDMIVGALFADNGLDYSGKAYVVLGKAGGFGSIDLAEFTANDGFTIHGDQDGDRAGFSVSSAGDINGDGFADMLVGAQYGDNNGDNAGEAYVIFGEAIGFGDLDLGNLAVPDGFRIEAETGGDIFGAVSSAGDVNGDGFDDFIVGAPRHGDNDTGRAYVFLGKAGGFGNIDLSYGGADMVVHRGGTLPALLGASVSSAGDVNGDGFDDILVGSGAGQAYVVFGGAGFGGQVDVGLLNSNPSIGFLIQGDAPGGTVSAAGDFDGDGFDDLIVGFAYGDRDGTDSGHAYIIFGKSTGFGTVNVATLPASDAILIKGDAAGDNAGLSVSAAGDIDGDGYDDVIVGAPKGGDGAVNPGEAYVIFGRPRLNDLDLRGTASSDTMSGDAGDDRIDGRGGNDRLSGLGGDDELIGGSGVDTLNGGSGSDMLRGGSGDDVLDGASGGDAMNGGSGNDVYRADIAGDRIVEGEGNGSDRLLARVGYTLADGVHIETMATFSSTGTTAVNLSGNSINNRITGNNGINRLYGNGGTDTLNGLGGNDHLYGGTGNDTLNGGTGPDRFYFNTALNGTTNRDAISAYAVPDDTIMLDRAIFTAIAAKGTLAAAAYRKGTAALDADDRIVYNSATGNIFYDADGSGAGAQILFARVTAGTALTRTDFQAYSSTSAAAPPAPAFAEATAPRATALEGASMLFRPFDGGRLEMVELQVV